ncbi:MAG: transcriptional regulator [Variovorax sp.]|nr:transcriptional regulator [Variovorax sp.]
MEAALDVQDKSAESVRAVDRALDILSAFRGVAGGLTVAELLKRVDLSRPTLYRLLRTLENKGFVASSGDPQRFRLGPSVAQLAHSWNAGLNLADVAAPAMRRVWEATGETVALFVPEGLMRLCVAEMPSLEALSFRRGVGYRERLVRGASGRSILAQIESGIDLESYAAGVDVDLEKCRIELAKIRKRGYAVSRNELIEGAVAIAVPVFDGSNRVVASLGVFGPSVRLSQAKVDAFGSLLVTEGAALSAALGQAGVVSV